MGEAKQRRKLREKLLTDCPACIFCAGKRASNTIEHLPPIAMFDARQRPKGLEFPSCKECNEGTRHADQIASLLGRAVPNSHVQPDSADFDRLLSGVRTNIPGALEELVGNPLSEKALRARLEVGDGSGVMHVGGPIISRHMEAFAIKFALALHYQVTGQAVPDTGGVSVRWFTNYQRLQGKFPESIQEILGPPQTLKQGHNEVSSQFQYAWASATDAVATGIMATFRFAFALIAFTAANRTTLEVEGISNEIHAPGSQLTLLGKD